MVFSAFDFPNPVNQSVLKSVWRLRDMWISIFDNTRVQYWAETILLGLFLRLRPPLAAVVLAWRRVGPPYNDRLRRDGTDGARARDPIMQRQPR